MNFEFEITEMVISHLFDWKTLTSIEGLRNLFYTLSISKYSTLKVKSENQTKFWFLFLKMRYLFLLLYLTNAQPELPDMMPCPDGWHQDIETATCFKAFESNPKSWNAAESHCQSFGGDLASITSQREQELVVSLLNRQGYTLNFDRKLDRKLSQNL